MNSHSKYNLSAQPPKSQRQSIFMVKLTESAELCLENYLLHQEELKCPLIHFENDYNGKLIIPSEASKGEDNIYHFNIKNEPSENLDINMQINGSEIKVLGAVKKNIIFLPKTDSFSKTRERYDNLVEIQNQHLVKEIEPGYKEKKWAPSKRVVSKKPSSTKDNLSKSHPALKKSKKCHNK